MSMDAIRGLGQGRPALLIGDSRVEHSFSFVPDVVAGLLALGEADEDVEGRPWHLPVNTVAPRELALRIARVQGRRGWTVTLPGWLIRALGPVVPLFGMLRETLYQWERPFLIDDSAFRARFPGVATDLDAAIDVAVAQAQASDERMGAAA
jgi:nucleoside-diphosphate-sugar epimerase